MKRKNKGISRIDSKNTHGWYVRIYANGGVFTSKLFSDRLYGGKQKALGAAKSFRDHNQMVAELQKDKSKYKKKKPFYDKPPKNNSSGVVGVNEIETEVRGRKIHYFQATWSEDGKAHSKKYYVTAKRPRDEAFELAVEHRRKKEEMLREKWQKEASQDS